MKAHIPYRWEPARKPRPLLSLSFIAGFLLLFLLRVSAITASPAMQARPASLAKHVHTKKFITATCRLEDYWSAQGSAKKAGKVRKKDLETGKSGNVDRSDPESTAQAILTAYKAKDLSALADFSTTSNKEILSEIAAQGEKHPRYQSIFSGWRWEAVQGWQGKLGEVRYKRIAGEPVAQVYLGGLDGDKIAVVTLTWEKGQWCFDDINRSDRQRFEKGNPEAPTDLH